MTLLVTAAGALLGLDRNEWLWVVLAVGLVWTAEAFNTAIERLADRVSTDHDPLLGAAKDLAAGAVLVAVAVALVIGALVFGPHLLVVGR